MKKIAVLSICAISLFFASCSNAPKQDEAKQGEKPNGLKLDSRDVKGTISTDANASAGQFSLTTNDPSDNSKMITLEGVTVKIDPKATIDIVPALKTLDSLKAGIERDAKEWGTFDVVEQNANGMLYHTVKDAFNTKEEGYNFVIVIKGQAKSYRLTGEGEDPLKPIADKQLAQKAFNTALTFKPAE